ncbi:hypothetical protein [Rhizobium terrae]|uniref:hypothetical protein n=1 Tax=Rhizobium terrae TaxID=2171756 RepID=UPI000E3D4955|nr:hypothetical protein [Rhizobium terrae]
MKKAIVFASMISVAGIGGAFAQDLGPTAPAPSVDKVTVVHIDQTDETRSSTNKVPPTLTVPNSQAAQAAQDAIQSDPKLLAALAAKNVELQNVAGIETAADGGKIVYVR